MENHPPTPEKTRGPSQMLSRHVSGSAFALEVGQGITILACLAALFGAAYHIAQLRNENLITRGQVSIDQAVQLLPYLIGFCLAVAVWFSLKRAIVLAHIAAEQDAENQRLWQKLAELQLRLDKSFGPEDGAADERSPSSQM